jgi:hypothetical protein
MIVCVAIAAARACCICETEWRRYGCSRLSHREIKKIRVKRSHAVVAAQCKETCTSVHLVLDPLFL